MSFHLPDWLQPPVFPQDAHKTQHAALLNFVLLLGAGLAVFLILADWLGPHPSPILITLDLAALAYIMVAWRQVHRGHTRQVGASLIVVGLVGLTTGLAIVGTVREAMVAGYLLVIVMASLLFTERGLVIAVAASALCITGLAAAEQTGLIRPTIYYSEALQWVTLIAWFACIGGVGYWSHRATRAALARADLELTAQQAAEAALRRSEEQLHEAQALAHLGSWEWDLHTQTLTWSDEVYRIFGVVAGEFAPSTEAFESFLHPDDREDFLSRRAVMLAETRQAVIDHRIIRRDGQVRWVQERAQVLVNEQGHTTRVTGTVQDITDRKQVEDALHASERNFRTFFDTIDHLLFVLDEHGHMLYTNAAVTHRLAYTPQELLGQSVLMAHPPDRRAEAGQIVAAMLAGQADYCPVPLQTKDGRQFPVETRVVRGEWNGHPAIFGVTKDLSALKASEEKFAAAFDASPALMALSDVDTGRYLDVNAAFLNTLGYSRAQVIGHTARELNLFHDLAQRVTALELLTQQGHLRDFEVDVVTRDGELRRGAFSAEYLSLQDRRILLTIMIDITARQRAEAQRQAALAALQESQAMVQGIIDAVPVRVFWKDKNLVYLGCNAAFARDAGFADPADIIGQDDYHMGWRDQAELYRSADRRVIDHNRAELLVEEPQTTPTGDTITLLTSKVPLHTAQGEVSGVLGTYLDITERKRAEEALRQSEEKYRAVIEQATEGVLLSAEDGEIIEWNQALAQITGIPSDTALGQPIWEVQHRMLGVARRQQMPVSLLRHSFLQMTASGQVPRRREADIELPDGTPRILLQTAFPIQTARGFRIGAIMQDITQRQQLEEALRASQARYDELVRRIPLGIYLLHMPASGHSYFEYVSPQFCQIVGLREETLLTDYEALSKAVHPADRASLHAANRDARAHVQPFRWEGRCVVDAETRWIRLESEPTRLDNGELQWSGVLSDITERKRTADAEHAQRQLAEALRDTAAALNGTLNLDEVFDRILVNVGRVVTHDTANLMLITQGIASIARHQGYAERGLVDFAARVRLTVSDVPNLQHMVQTGQPRVMPDVRRDPDWIDWPESRYIRSIASAPIRVKGVTLGFINLNSATPGFYSAEQGERLQAFANQAAVAVDNARLYAQVQQHAQTLEQRVRDRTAELQIANEQLQELDRLKDEFLSRISHELRTPLTSIKIYLELLDTAKPEKREKYLQTINREADRLQIMIEDVLHVTQLSQGRLDVQLDVVQLNDVLEPRLIGWGQMAARRSLEFHLELAAGLPPARLDKLLTVQAVAQLINNAISYTASGSITLATQARTDQGERWVTLGIRDTGPGIAPDELPHIFDRFYRGRAAADYRTPGTGIGLTIAHDIARQINGRLTVESELGAGSTFTLWLPAAT